MNKRILIPACTLLALAALFIGFFLIKHAGQEKSVVSTQEREKPLFVHTIKVHPENPQSELILPSFLDPINITPICARTNGYLINWLVDIGDKVKEGDLLACIDTPDVDQEVVQAEGDLGAAIARENIAKITMERGINLYRHNPEAISQEAVDQMVAAYHQSLADIEAAKGRLGQYKYLQGFKNLYAPFDGTIIERAIDIGSLITAGSENMSQQMFQIAKSDVLRAFVNVPQNYFHLIQDGMEAEVTVAQLPKKIFIGRIDRNAGMLDPVSRTLLTQINIDNKRGDLLPGLYAEVKLKFKQEPGSFIIPVEALIIRSGPPYVAIVDANNRVHLREVKIGRDYGKSVQIIEGLSAEDEIISPATDRIKDGMQIRK